MAKVRMLLDRHVFFHFCWFLQYRINKKWAPSSLALRISNRISSKGGWAAELRNAGWGGRSGRPDRPPQRLLGREGWRLLTHLVWQYEVIRDTSSPGRQHRRHSTGETAPGRQHWGDSTGETAPRRQHRGDSTGSRQLPGAGCLAV